MGTRVDHALRISLSLADCDANGKVRVATRTNFPFRKQIATLECPLVLRLVYWFRLFVRIATRSGLFGSRPVQAPFPYASSDLGMRPLASCPISSGAFHDGNAVDARLYGVARHKLRPLQVCAVVMIRIGYSAASHSPTRRVGRT